MSNNVFLDALVPREDFDVEEDSPTSGMGRSKDTASISDLGFGDFFTSVLRKPDFQRETNEWDSARIVSLIQSFLDGDLIPAIILWKNKSNIFIIDGAHRLSALIAWVNNDYGDGKRSADFFEGKIPDEIIESAGKVRSEIDTKIGSYEALKRSLANQDGVDPQRLERAKALGHLAVQLQWVEGSSDKAESSFFTINQQGTPISDTEIELLKGRRRPISIAARAILRSGKGHKYWQNFSQENQTRITELSTEIHNLIFKPDYSRPIKSLDLPLADKTNTAQLLPLVFNMIGIINTDAKSSNSDDSNGDETVRILRSTLKSLQRITGNHPSSLGLHPAVYFYSRRGAFKIASFWSTILLVKDLESRNMLRKFTSVRGEFEKIILYYDSLDQQIVRKKRTAESSYQDIKSLHFKIIELLIKGKNPNEIEDDLGKGEFSYIKMTPNSRVKQDKKGKFTTQTKNEIFLTEALSKASKCKICGGLLHQKSISFDHITRAEDGGSANVENGQLTHHYCNTGIKN